MSTKIHILHLHPKGLSWVTLEGRYPKGRIVDTGSLTGDAPTCLNGWLPGKSGKDSEVYIYDSRPQYFSFVVSLPAKAARSSEKIIPLRVRQEIGLGEEALRWTVRNLGESNGQVNLLVIVSKNESQDDLAQWSSNSGIKSLWAGPDHSAVVALRESKILDDSSSVVSCPANSSPDFYTTLDDGRINRTQGEAVPQNIDSTKIVVIGLGLKEAEKCLSGVSGRLSLDATERFIARFKAKLPETDVTQVEKLDAVLMGGLLEVGFKRPATSSIFGQVEYASPLAEIEKRLKLKPLAVMAASFALIFIVSFAFARYQRGSDTEKALDQASKLDDMTEIYNEQADVLAKVKSDRIQLIPFIEAVYKIAPADSTLQSLDIAENGLMVIAATTKTQEAGTAFFKDLASTKLFDDIQITYLKLDDGKKWVRLQINAKIRGWKK